MTDYEFQKCTSCGDIIKTIAGTPPISAADNPCGIDYIVVDA